MSDNELDRDKRDELTSNHFYTVVDKLKIFLARFSLFDILRLSFFETGQSCIA